MDGEGVTPAYVTQLISQYMRDLHIVHTPLRYAFPVRGFVEDVMDPENRGRVRVRVPSLHPPSVPTFALPWAERGFPDATADAGDVLPLTAGSLKDYTKQGNLETWDHTGDQVMVMFEGGNTTLPFVIAVCRSTRQTVSDAIRGDAPYPRRLRMLKTRHGSKIEMNDATGDMEVKISMPNGHVLHMREAPGGAGIHLTTASGMTLSLQDEEPGTPEPTTQTAYDASPDVVHKFASAQSQSQQELPAEFVRSPDGIPVSATSPVSQGLGVAGVMLRTKAGHTIELRDNTNPGITLRTVYGHEVLLDDNAKKIKISTPGANSLTMQDGAGVHLDSEFGQEIFMEPEAFGIRWAQYNMLFGFGVAGGTWNITGSLAINVSEGVTITSGDNMTIHAGGVLTEQGDGGRVEIPPVGP